MINKINLSAMPNEVYVQYHKEVCIHIQNYGTTALGLEATTVKAYEDVIDRAQDYVNHPLRSIYTTRLSDLDSQRNDLLGAILTRLRYARTSADATVQQAVEDIDLQIVERYKLSSKEKPGKNKTALIGGLLMDLEKIDEEALKALGIDALSQKLKTVNDGYEQTYLARNTERRERGKGVMRALRTECDALYRQLCLEADCYASRTDEALAAIGDPTEREKKTAQRTLLRSFVEEMNEHVAHYKAYYLSRGKATADAAPDEDTAADGTDDGPTDGDATDGGSRPSGPTDVTEVTEVS